MTIAPERRAAARPAKTWEVATGGSPLGVMRGFSKNPIALLTDVFQQHGDAVKVRFLANQYFYFLSDPDHIRHVLATNSANYSKAPHPAFLLLGRVMGKGLVTSDGDLWSRQRRLIQPGFTKQRVATYGDMMTGATLRMLDRWRERGARGDDGPVNVDAEMMQLTLDIVGQTLFNMDIINEAGKVGTAFSEVSEQFAKLLGNPFGPLMVNMPFLPLVKRFNANVAELDEVIHDIIASRRDNPVDTGDLLSLLMAVTDEDGGRGMSDQQLRDEVMTLLLSGHETTADALTWTFHLLAEHPEVLEQLEHEVDTQLAGRTATVADLPSLPYTKQVVQEAMRLYPPIYLLARWGNGPDEVGGLPLPKDASITICPWVVHRHPDYWSDAERFDPERFTPENVAKQHHYAYVPFSGGQRQCLGVHFALMEAQLLLTTVVQQFRLRSVPGHRVVAGPVMTLRPEGGLPMYAEPRSAS
ncbi:cytochrome P450 [Kitasatospora sp. NPDC058190]|uniref:cytochrome P450 n=1 Tax=Kitasatospora sp. NPDC058190 TaxID=3346371 RepID=UPI0036D80344